MVRYLIEGMPEPAVAPPGKPWEAKKGHPSDCICEGTGWREMFSGAFPCPRRHKEE